MTTTGPSGSTWSQNQGNQNNQSPSTNTGTGTGTGTGAGTSTGPGNPIPYRTDATRLLCAGVYFDAEFRGRVIEELVEREERPVAPSLGVDVVPVLAHALRVRRRETGVGLVLLLLWVAFIWVDLSRVTVGGGFPLFPAMPWSIAYAVVCFALWVGRAGAGRSVAVYTLDRLTLRKALIGKTGRLTALLPRVVPFLAAAYWLLAIVMLFVTEGAVWPAVVFPLLMVVPVWMHRTYVAGVMREQLSQDAFQQQPRTPPPAQRRYQRIAAAIDREQHAALTIYDPFRPFLGVGDPYGPWSFALELRRKKPSAGGSSAAGSSGALSGGSTFDAQAQAQVPSQSPSQAPLTSREVIDLVRPRLEKLRQSAAATSRDRLRGLEIDEYVYLPVGPERGQVSYAAPTVATHLRESVDEGGEARRYFLRIRVGAWDEQVVVSVLVRVHTQGGMLVLEVVPHVLKPIRPEFAAVDVIAARGVDDWARDGVRAVLTSPVASVAAGVSMIRTAITVFRTWLTDPEHGTPDGPAASVRELASVGEVSLMQEMDVSRYVKTVQDRIASGVREALRSKGYETDEFEQQIVQVSGDGVFIGHMSGGAFAKGDNASAKNTTNNGTWARPGS
ncbi:hypothetical protein [Streptomyces sp. Da 82-17]|uniref:hypothetical protein n=1 Tax=Streptomyces sp. Da 82-17 TaxID=3377116 RepID=UPI0038D3B79B